MELVEFFRSVITGEGGWFCLAHTGLYETEEETKRAWKEEFFSWPDELPKIISRIHQLGDKTNIYFSPYLFSEPKSLKENAITGRTIVADLDEAQILTLPLKPNILVETSPDRHQGYWILKTEIPREEHEALSKKLSYSIPRCDKTGWFLGKKVRVPNTFNHKYTTGAKYIRVVDTNSAKYDAQQIEELYVDKEVFNSDEVRDSNEVDLSWADACTSFDVSPIEMLAKIRASFPGIARVYTQYTVLSNDRSTALWALMTALFRAGLKREYVFYIAYNGINNKFKDLRYGGIRELAKDVIRAELSIRLQAPDIKSKISTTRRLRGNDSDKNSAVTGLVREHLERMGSFVHADDDSAWFIREDTGKAIQISTRSPSLETMIDTIFGINSSEREYSYLVRSLYATTMEAPVNGILSNLSLYDKDEQLFMLHTGKKDVLVVRSTGITRVSNGYNGVIFPWTPSAKHMINPKYQALESKWDDILFGDCLDNVMDLKKEDAQAILKVWFLTVLLREGLASRPILALFGSPGSGKSTLFRRVYVLLYGRARSIGAITREDDFDTAVSSDPLIVLDNVDSYLRWLPDRLAVMAAPNEVIKRKLYTDNDKIILKRNAMLGITAHAPKFGREDVTDRLLLLNFERLSKFKSDSEILDRIMSLRNALWGAILQDIQIILNTKMPRRGYPQFRVEDFAIYGYWIATALGIEDEFYNGIETIRKSQRGFILEEDAIIIDALIKFVNKNTGKDKGKPERTEFKTAGQLWPQLQANTTETTAFEKRYTNAVALGKKLWTLNDALQEILDVQVINDSKRGSRSWSFAKKELEGVYANGTA